jgi:hypothetical protein
MCDGNEYATRALDGDEDDGAEDDDAEDEEKGILEASREETRAGGVGSRRRFAAVSPAGELERFGVALCRTGLLPSPSSNNLAAFSSMRWRRKSSYGLRSASSPSHRAGRPRPRSCATQAPSPSRAHRAHCGRALSHFTLAWLQATQDVGSSAIFFCAI